MAKKQAAKKLTKRTATFTAPTRPAEPQVATFKKVVDAGEPTPTQAQARKRAKVRIDRQGRVALEIVRTASTVQYIPHALEGLDVIESEAVAFDRAFGPLDEYPPERAAKLMLGFATVVGLTARALAALETLVTPSQAEYAALAKKTAARLVVEQVQRTGKTQKVSKPKVARVKPEGGGSAAGMFRELILAGKLDDDKIFAAVKTKFGLDDSRRNYVQWYRKKLIKDGQLKEVK